VTESHLLMSTSTNLPGITPSLSNNSRSEFPNVYPTLYPFLPPQIGPRDEITRPSFLPALSRHLGNTNVSPPGIQSGHSPSAYLRSNQHRQSSVYYAPKVRRDSTTLAGPSATPSPSPPPADGLSSPSSLSSDTRFGSSSDDVFSGSPQDSGLKSG
jgi:hypothetical protein